MEIFTIGFTQRSAREFFGTLRRAGIKRLVDVRLNNTSQLAGFSKRDDLEYFLGELCGAQYVHEPLLAPSEDLFTAYKKAGGAWSVYEAGFRALLQERQVERVLDRASFAVPSVLLCSERTAEHCHRRLVAEYLRAAWGDVGITHL
jgi:uncharacterized protein (DUF488 family)